MNRDFLTHVHMGAKEALTAVAVTIVLSTSPANAENIDGQVVCDTRVACEKLSNSIQAQIKELENKGLENLTDDEFVKYSTLSDELIAVERTITAAEKEKQKAYAEVNKRLDAIKSTLQ